MFEIYFHDELFIGLGLGLGLGEGKTSRACASTQPEPVQPPSTNTTELRQSCHSLCSQAHKVLGLLKAGRHVKTKTMSDVLTDLLAEIEDRTTEAKFAMRQVPTPQRLPLMQ